MKTADQSPWEIKGVVNMTWQKESCKSGIIRFTQELIHIPNTDDFQQKIILSFLVITKKPKAFVVIQWLLRQKCLLRRKCLFFWMATPAYAGSP